MATEDALLGDLADLTLGFSTLAPRAAHIVLPADLHGAEVVVIAQLSEGTAAQMKAEEAAVMALPNLAGARVVTLSSRGVAKSRNEVMRQASRQFLLFCDDDIRVNLAGVARACALLRKHKAALALCQAIDEDGIYRKRYSATVTSLTRFNSAKAATYELIVDVDRVRAANVWFDEEYGAGAENYLGDEYIFVVDALRAGLTGFAVPEVAAIHPSVSSGSRWGSQEERSARARAIERAWGRSGSLGKALFATKNLKNLGGVRNAIRFIASSPRER